MPASAPHRRLPGQEEGHGVPTSLPPAGLTRFTLGSVEPRPELLGGGATRLLEANTKGAKRESPVLPLAALVGQKP